MNLCESCSFFENFFVLDLNFSVGILEKGTIFTCIFVKIETGVFDYYCFSDLKFNDFFFVTICMI